MPRLEAETGLAFLYWILAFSLVVIEEPRPDLRNAGQQRPTVGTARRQVRLYRCELGCVCQHANSGWFVV